MDIAVTVPKKEYENIEKENKFVEDNDDVVQYWSMKAKPKYFELGDKVYFVRGGHIIGYQECIDFVVDAKCEVTDRTWEGFNLVLKCPMIELEKPIPMKGFQGYRYYERLKFEDVYYSDEVIE